MKGYIPITLDLCAAKYMMIPSDLKSTSKSSDPLPDEAKTKSFGKEGFGCCCDQDSNIVDGVSIQAVA